MVNFFITTITDMSATSMYLMSSSSKTWKERWFVLGKGYIVYYKEENGEECGQIAFCDIVNVQPAYDCEFQPTIKVNTISGEYYIAAKTDDEYDAWFKLLTSVSNIHRTQVYLITDESTNEHMKQQFLLACEDIKQINGRDEVIQVETDPSQLDGGAYNTIIAFFILEVKQSTVNSIVKRFTAARKARPTAVVQWICDRVPEKTYCMIEGLASKMNVMVRNVEFTGFDDDIHMLQSCLKISIKQIREKGEKLKQEYTTAAPVACLQHKNIYLKAKRPVPAPFRIAMIGQPLIAEIVTLSEKTSIVFEGNEMEIDVKLTTENILPSMFEEVDVVLLCCCSRDPAGIEFIEAMQLMTTNCSAFFVVVYFNDDEREDTKFADVVKLSLRQWNCSVIEVSHELGVDLKPVWVECVRSKIYSRIKAIRMQNPAQSTVGSYKWNIEDVRPRRVIKVDDSTVLYEADNRITKEKYVVRIKKGESFQERRNSLQDAVVMGHLEHPCIMHMYGYSQSFRNSGFGVVLEPLDVCLAKVITSDQLNITDRLIIAIGTCFGIRKLHMNGYLHRGIDPESIMLNAEREPKLSKFENSGRDGSKFTANQDKYVYTPPEILAGEEISLSMCIDIYAFGMLLYELLARKRIVCEQTKWVDSVVNHDFRPDPPAHFDSDTNVLIRRCWHRSPIMRPSFTDIIGVLVRVAKSREDVDFEKVAAYIKKIEPTFGIEQALEMPVIELLHAKVKEIAEEAYTRVKQIGHGAYSTVHLVKSNMTGEFYAMKRLRPLDRDSAKIFNREVVTLTSIAHPCVVGLHGIRRPDNEGAGAILLLEYISGSDLQTFMSDRNMRDSLTPTDKAIIITDIAFGIHALHKENFIHRDLKPANIMLNGNCKRAKICDLGMSRLEDLDMSAMIGTPLYMAPEVINNEAYGTKSDVYSFSLILYHVFTGRGPGDGQRIQIYSWMKSISEGHRPKFVSNDPLTQAGRELIENCWAGTAESRPDMDEIINMIGSVRGNLIKGVNEKEFMDYYTEMLKYK